MEQEIIKPIDKEVLKSELIPDRQLRMTNKSHNEIYVITAHNAPNVMKEIGRLREVAFREAGGGTGKEMDIDEFDICENCYKQLIVWNPEAEEIIGGYRYLAGTDWEYDEKGQPILATSHMFHFSEKFIKEYAPWTIELEQDSKGFDYYINAGEYIIDWGYKYGVPCNITKGKWTRECVEYLKSKGFNMDYEKRGIV